MSSVAQKAARRPSDAKKPAIVDRSTRARSGGSSRKDLVYAEVLDRAAELFLARGYANTRMKDIGDAVGMSRSSLYHYFENKEGVLLALTEGDVEAATESLEQLLRDPNIGWAEKLRNWVEGNIREKLESGIRFRLVDRIHGELPEMYQEFFRQARRRVLALLVEIIEGGVRDGEFCDIDPKVTAFALIGMSNWTAWWYSPQGARTPDEIARSMTDLVLGGLLKAKGSEQAQPDIEEAISQLKGAQQTLEGLIQRDGK